MNGNLYATFQDAFADRLDSVFLDSPATGNLTFRELDEATARYGAVLSSHGIEPGDRVVVQVSKSVEAVILYLACLRIGAVFVPLNTAYTDSELAYFLDNAEPALFVSDDGRAPTDVPTAALLGDGSLAEQATNAAPDRTVCERSGDDLAALLYTSGTTGRSKGAMLSHDNLRSNARALVELWAFTADDVLLHALPIFHVHGLFVALHCALLSACRVRFLSAFNAETVCSELTDATVLMGVPTFYTRLLSLDHFRANECSSIRVFISGSAPMTEAVHAAFTERTGAQVLERYGMSEAGMITSNPYSGERVPGTVGFPLPGVSVRVRDEHGNDCGHGEVGSVEITGPNVFSGYWRMPEKTASEFTADGWFVTGDLGSLEASGRLTLVGRGKDLIIAGGYNIYPKEIELVIDAVDGVAESAVIGVPHPDLGEGVVAVVVGDGSLEADVQERVQSELARFKQPRRYIFVDTLPRNAMGKVQKNVLRESYASSFES